MGKPEPGAERSPRGVHRPGWSPGGSQRVAHEVPPARPARQRGRGAAFLEQDRGVATLLTIDVVQ